MLRAVYDSMTPAILEPLGRLIVAASEDMDMEPNGSKPYFIGHWYLKPHQQGLELIISAIGSAVATNIWFKKCLCFGPAPRVPPESRTFKLMRAFCFASILLLTVHKHIRKMDIFMLCPCHATLFLLALTMSLPPQSRLASWMLNIHLYNVWGTVLAIAAPDLRECDMFLEKANFWFEHILLLVLPAYLAGTGRYTLCKPSTSMAACAFILKAAYHSWILLPVSLATGANLNYLLVPPPGALEVYGRFYRIVMLFGCLAASHLTRFAYVTPLMRLLELGRSPAEAALHKDLQTDNVDGSASGPVIVNAFRTSGDIGGDSVGQAQVAVSDHVYKHPTGTWSSLGEVIRYIWRRQFSRLRRDSGKILGTFKRGKKRDSDALVDNAEKRK